MTAPRVLLTGATGYVGWRLLAARAARRGVVLLCPPAGGAARRAAPSTELAATRIVSLTSLAGCMEASSDTVKNSISISATGRPSRE